MIDSQSLEGKVKTIKGDFRRAAEFSKGTWQSSAEITKDRLDNQELQRKWFYTNNHSLFDIEEGDAFFYFGVKEGSIFRKETIPEAYRQLLSAETNHYYKPSNDDVFKAKQNSLRFRISDLELIFDNPTDNYGYILVDTSDEKASNFKTESQRKFAEAVYGSMEVKEDKESGEKYSDYARAMKMLNKECIETSRIYTLRKETVLRDAKEGAISRACWLNYFNNYSNFGAGDRIVGINNALRGVLDVAEGDSAERISPVQEAYNTLLNTPYKNLLAEAVKKPEIIERMLKLSSMYVKQK